MTYLANRYANHRGTKKHENQRPCDLLLIVYPPKKDHVLPIPSLPLSQGINGELNIIQSIGLFFAEEIWVMKCFCKEYVVSYVLNSDPRVLFAS